MLQVAIVEDELFMREFLENCIGYDELGLVICGSFCCAEDALDKLCEIKPDLVITDIKMPGMDGITFMSEMLKINPDTHFLVISNYQDFEIVRNAFRIGICDYIPKIDFELDHYRETLQAFIETKRELTSQSQGGQSKNLKEQFWSESQPPGEHAGGFGEEQMIFALLDILNYEHVVQTRWEMGKEQLKLAVSNCLEELLTEFGNGEFFFNEYDKIIFLFSSKVLSAVRRLLETIRDFLKSHFQLEACIFLEDTHTSLRHLKVKYTELYELKKFRFFLPENAIITKGIVSDFCDEFEYMQAYAEMETLLQKNEFNAILKRLGEIKQIKPAAACVEELLFFYQNMFLLIASFSKAHRLPFADAASIKELLASSNYETVSALLISGIRKIAEDAFFPEKKLNQQIDEYIEKHYPEKISLEEMARFFQYEYSYFSKMFRRMKGVTFRKYLNNIRLEKAMKLVRSTSLKYSEIAREVGYQNYEHFSRCFQEKYGCWPNEIERTDTDA